MYHTNAAYIRMMEAARAYLQTGGKMQDLERDLKSLHLTDSSWTCRGVPVFAQSMAQPSFTFVPPKQEPSTQERIAAAAERIAAALEAISAGMSNLAAPQHVDPFSFGPRPERVRINVIPNTPVPIDLTGSQNGGEPLSDADPDVMPPLPDMDGFIAEFLGKDKETD